MRRSLRQAASALLVAAVLVTVAAPAVAAPRKELGRTEKVRSPSVFAEFLAWLEEWIDLSAFTCILAPGGPTSDPDGQPGASGSWNDLPTIAEACATTDPDV